MHQSRFTQIHFIDTNGRRQDQKSVMLLILVHHPLKEQLLEKVKDMDMIKDMVKDMVMDKIQDQTQMLVANELLVLQLN